MSLSVFFRDGQEIVRSTVFQSGVWDAGSEMPRKESAKLGSNAALAAAALLPPKEEEEEEPANRACERHCR